MDPYSNSEIGSGLERTSSKQRLLTGWPLEDLKMVRKFQVNWWTQSSSIVHVKFKFAPISSWWSSCGRPPCSAKQPPDDARPTTKTMKWLQIWISHVKRNCFAFTSWLGTFTRFLSRQIVHFFEEVEFNCSERKLNLTARPTLWLCPELSMLILSQHWQFWTKCYFERKVRTIFTVGKDFRSADQSSVIEKKTRREYETFWELLFFLSRPFHSQSNTLFFAFAMSSQVVIRLQWKQFLQNRKIRRDLVSLLVAHSIFHLPSPPLCSTSSTWTSILSERYRRYKIM